MQTMVATRDSSEKCPLIQDDQKRQQANEITKRRSRFAVLCILFFKLCERLTFYGVSASVVFFSKNVLKFPSPFPSAIALVFQGKAMFE